MTAIASRSNILLVDDGRVRQAVQGMLEAHGWSMIEATPETALALAKRHGAEVILLNLDIGPAEAGALATKFKLEPVTCAIPIIVTGTVEAHASRLASWATDSIGWPVEPRPLLAKLQRLLANRRLRGLYVLVVDDEPDLVEIMTTALSQQGFLTASAGNGLEALESAKFGQPDAILLDLAMPRLDGWEVLESLKQNASLASIRVVILTGAAKTDLDRKRGLSHGADAYLMKPCSIEQVVQTLHTILKRL